MSPNYFISKLYRHSHSVSMVVPQPVRKNLGLSAGDHVVLQWQGTDGKFELSKLEPVGVRDVEPKKEKAVIPAAISPERSAQQAEDKNRRSHW